MLKNYKLCCVDSSIDESISGGICIREIRQYS